MENYKSFLFVLGIFLLLGHAKAENRIEPRSNVNLGPIQGWRSAYFCMMYNKSASCLVKDQLSDTVVVTVSDETAEYCKEGGRRDHILSVLKCIYDVKRDFWFANNITVKVLLREKISDGCKNNKAISTQNYTNKGPKEY